jgi:hypothetical protein
MEPAAGRIYCLAKLSPGNRMGGKRFMMMKAGMAPSQQTLAWSFFMANRDLGISDGSRH